MNISQMVTSHFLIDRRYHDACQAQTLNLHILCLLVHHSVCVAVAVFVVVVCLFIIIILLYLFSLYAWLQQRYSCL